MKRWRSEEEGGVGAEEWRGGSDELKIRYALAADGLRFTTAV